jgi:uncharacterized protein
MKRSVFVFDTNALISAFLLKGSVSDLAFRRATSNGALAVSEILMDEFLEVLLRKKFDRYFTEGERAEIIKEVEQYAVIFFPTEKITDCKDPDDNMVLELAVASEASCIITGDKKHLIPLHPFRGIPIVTADEFLKMI